MKKVLSILLCCTVLIGISACGAKIANPNTLERTITEKPEAYSWEESSDQEVIDNRIKDIVLSEANVQEEDVQFLQINKDYDDSRTEIDVEFYAGNNEYDYTLDEHGNILEFEVDNNF